MKSDTNYTNAKQVAEDVYHAHYTANLIEDEIRKIRKEDYNLRKKYHELKFGEIEEDK
jgi:hypothetical protein